MRREDFYGNRPAQRRVMKSFTAVPPHTLHFLNMRLRFNEAKVTQAAGLFLKKRGGKMSYMKLLKLLYLTDREALVRWGRPVTTDVYVSMDHGPVLSKTLDIINEGPDSIEGRIWAQYISAASNYEVSLLEDTPTTELSRAEEKLIDEIFCKFGAYSRWQIRDYVHTLPEWTDPHGSAVPIRYSDILVAAKKTEEEVESILEELRNLEHFQNCLSL